MLLLLLPARCDSEGLKVHGCSGMCLVCGCAEPASLCTCLLECLLQKPHAKHGAAVPGLMNPSVLASEQTQSVD